MSDILTGLMGGNLSIAGSGPASWQQQQQLYPPVTPAVPTPAPFFGPLPSMPPNVRLSDDDICLMAACISNGHPELEGFTGGVCFCKMKRLQKGLSKE